MSSKRKELADYSAKEIMELINVIQKYFSADEQGELIGPLVCNWILAVGFRNVFSNLEASV